MAETVTIPIPIPESTPSPGSEIGYDGGTARGLKVIGDCVNTLVATKHPTSIHDMLLPEEYALTTSDPFHIAGMYREWMVKVPSYLNVTAAANRQYTLQVYLAKTAGILQYRVYANGSTVATYSVTSAVLTAQWVTLSSTVSIADTADSVRIGLGLITYNGGTAASNRVYAVRLVPNLWTNISDQAGGWTNPVTSGTITPVPIYFLSDWSGCHSYLIQSMQDIIQYVWQRRTGNLYQSAWYGDYSSYSDLTKITRIRINPLPGITTMRVYIRAKRSTVDGLVGVTTDTFSDTVSAPSTITWVYIDVSVIAGAPVNMFIQGKEVSIYGVSVYGIDPNY